MLGASVAYRPCSSLRVMDAIDEKSGDVGQLETLRGASVPEPAIGDEQRRRGGDFRQLPGNEIAQAFRVLPVHGMVARQRRDDSIRRVPHHVGVRGVGPQRECKGNTVHRQPPKVGAEPRAGRRAHRESSVRARWNTIAMPPRKMARVGSSVNVTSTSTAANAHVPEPTPRILPCSRVAWRRASVRPETCPCTLTIAPTRSGRGRSNSGRRASCPMPAQ